MPPLITIRATGCEDTLKQVTEFWHPAKKLLREEPQSPYYYHTLKSYTCSIFSQCYKLVAGYGRRTGQCCSFSQQTLRPCSALQEHQNTKGCRLIRLTRYNATSLFKSCELHSPVKALLFSSSASREVLRDVWM